MTGPIDHRPPQMPFSPRQKRSLGRWLVLLLVWAGGIVMWILYFALVTVVLTQIL